jgi:hypothetical protein
MLGNEEQREAFRDALVTEKAGYAQRVAAAKSVGDSAAVERYQNRMKQVDAEIAKLDGGDDPVELSPAEKVAKAKSQADVDAVADELGYEFEDGVNTVKEKKAALEEHLAA